MFYAVRGQSESTEESVSQTSSCVHDPPETVRDLRSCTVQADLFPRGAARERQRPEGPGRKFSGERVPDAGVLPTSLSRCWLWGQGPSGVLRSSSGSGTRKEGTADGPELVVRPRPRKLEGKGGHTAGAGQEEPGTQF